MLSSWIHITAEIWLDIFSRSIIEFVVIYCAHRLLVGYVVTLFLNDTSTTCFDPVRSSSGRYFYVIAALCCFF
jgi:hypothetical protein